MLFIGYNLTCECSRMVMRGDVPFLRIVKSIPREMRDKLPQEYISILETTVCHRTRVVFVKNISNGREETTKSRALSQSSAGIAALLSPQIWRTISSLELSTPTISIYQTTHLTKYEDIFPYLCIQTSFLSC